MPRTDGDCAHCGAFHMDHDENDPCTKCGNGGAAAKPEDHEAILARFKTQYVKEETGAVDAWLRCAGTADVVIEYQLNAALSELAPEALLEKLGKFPTVFEGIGTMITWFPKDAE